MNDGNVKGHDCLVFFVYYIVIHAYCHIICWFLLLDNFLFIFLLTSFNKFTQKYIYYSKMRTKSRKIWKNREFLYWIKCELLDSYDSSLKSCISYRLFKLILLIIWYLDWACFSWSNSITRLSFIFLCFFFQFENSLLVTVIGIQK
jgi:hypothetical protein